MKYKKKSTIKIFSYSLILLSLLIIFFSYKKYGFNGLIVINQNDKTTKSLNQLYVKTIYEKEAQSISKIAIKNGCGKKKLGLIYKRYLLDIGYDVTETANAEHFGHELTKIIFHKDNKSSAQYLSKELGVHDDQLIKQTNLNNFHDLTLILGQNYNNLKSYKIAKKYNPFIK